MKVLSLIREGMSGLYRAESKSGNWREETLSVILTLGALLGAVTAVPSIWFAAHENFWALVVVDVFALLWIFVIWLNPFFSYIQRAVNFLALVFVLAIWLTAKIGFLGLIYLLAFPVLTALLVGLRSAFYCIGVASVCLCAISYYVGLDINIPGMSPDSSLRIFVVAINYAFVASVLSVAISLLLTKLDHSLAKQRDISVTLERGQADLELANEELRLVVAAVSHLNDVVMVVQVTKKEVYDIDDFKTVFVNNAFVKVTGFEITDVQDKSPRMLLKNIARPSDLLTLREQLESRKNLHHEFMCFTRYGNEFWLDVDGIPLLDTNGKLTHWVFTGRDISERKKNEEHIYRLAYFDVLTGLPNRRLLMDRLGSLFNVEKDKNGYSAVLFVDLDHFKYINDARGHSVGDALLCQVSQRLCKLLREADTVSHLGGDEFVILLSRIANDAKACTQIARAMAEKIRVGMNDPFDVESTQYSLSCSIGISLTQGDKQKPQDLLREADTAMYRAKTNGRNQIVFYETGMQDAVDRRLTLERELSQAINEGQLQMHIQSQVDRMGKPIGAELLMRWFHKVKGEIPPSVFIPIAEDSGAIIPLGDWVLYEACMAVLKLQATGWDIPVSINVSPKQFRQPDFVEKVKRYLRESGAPANRIVFEVTEGLLINDWQDTIARMHELTALGIRFSVDDFGTGYSSLAYIKKLPLYELKIDRSFIQDTPRNSNDTGIVQAILSMANHLNMKVVAEGVETREQADFLWAHGCTAVQGFLYDSPTTIDNWIAIKNSDSNGQANVAKTDKFQSSPFRILGQAF